MTITKIKPQRDPNDSHAEFAADLPADAHYPAFSIDSPVPFEDLGKGGVPLIKVAISGESVLYQSVIETADSIPVAYASVVGNPFSPISFYHQQYGAFTATEIPGEFQRQVEGGRTTEILKFSEAGKEITFTIRRHSGSDEPPVPDTSIRLRVRNIQRPDPGEPPRP